MRTARTELTRLDGVQRLPNGALRVDAVPTRAGVLVYRDTTGTERREYRPPSEVFAADSLATLRGATVTDLHPKELVTPANWATLSKGHVGDDVRADGPLVAASLVVQDAAAVAAVERRERVELSCGYTCELDATPGVTPEGERYDAVQRSIRYNHVALGPEGWGRAGPDCALRLDGGDAVVCVRTDARANDVRATAPAEERRMRTIKIAGREYKLDSAEDMAAAQGAADEQQKKTDADAAIIEQMMKQAADMMSVCAKLQAQIQATAEQPSAEPSPEVLDSMLAERETLITSARKVLGADAKLTGKPATEIKRLVVAKALPRVDAAKLTAERLDGMFEAITAAEPDAQPRADGVPRNDALAAANDAAHAAARDGARADSIDDVAARYQREQEERGRRPLGATK